MDDRGVVENWNFAAWYFLTVFTHFLDPMGTIGPKMDPEGPHCDLAP